MINKIIISAPSGSGKTTIIKQLLSDNLDFSISATTRAKRPNEIDGKDYYFISTDSFLKKIQNDEFLEYQEVYGGAFYGTLKSEVDRIHSKGKNIIFDVDVIGGCNIKKHFENSLSIFIKPPSIEELRRRLTLRFTDTFDVIEARITKAEYELTFADKYDVIIVNDDITTAIELTKKHITNFINKMEIKILGTNITQCRIFEQHIRDVVEKNNIKATIINMSDANDATEMTKFGIFVPNAMIVNDKVEIKGRVAKSKEIKTVLDKYLK